MTVTHLYLCNTTSFAFSHEMNEKTLRYQYPLRKHDRIFDDDSVFLEEYSAHLRWYANVKN